MSWETEESFESLLAKSFRKLNPGEKVTGIVTAITPTEIQVDVGARQATYIPLSGLRDDPGVRVGDEIEAYVVSVYADEGMAELSRKRPYIPKRGGAANNITNSDIHGICDFVCKEVLTEVQENLSQMKPELISSMVDMVVRKVDSHYLSQIEELEKRVSKMERAINRIGVKTK